MQEIINNALAYIGKKFDELINVQRSISPKIDVNFANMPPVVLDASELDIIVKAVEDLGKLTDSTGKRTAEQDIQLDKVINLLSSLSKQMEKTGMGLELKTLTDIRAGIAKLSDTYKKATPKQDTKEAKKTNTLLNSLIKSVDSSFIPEVVIDMDELKVITKGLKDLHDAIHVQNKTPDTRLDKVIKVLSDIAKKKVVVPDTIKIDAKQLGMISNPTMPSYQGIMPASKAITANVAMTSADTEYSYTFPEQTVAFYIKIRSQNTKLLIAWTTGQLAVSGDASAYFTVPQNGMQSREGLSIGGHTIYFESGAATQVCELIVYTV